VLCGDPNTPRREYPDGTVFSFARDSKGRLRPERGTEWDDGELGVVPRLSELGFQDAIRALHGYDQPERSWAFRHGGGWRLDHLFASAELTVAASRYHHDWRLAGLSDHSALEADLTPPA
jgi:exonuclease III